MAKCEVGGQQKARCFDSGLLPGGGTTISFRVNQTAVRSEFAASDLLRRTVPRGRSAGGGRQSSAARFHAAAPPKCGCSCFRVRSFEDSRIRLTFRRRVPRGSEPQAAVFTLTICGADGALEIVMNGIRKIDKN